MKFRIYILFFILFSALPSCTEKETSEFTDTPIVESYLRPGDFLNLQITRQIPFSSGIKYSADDIDNLTINVTHNNIVSTLISLGSGKYVDSSLVVKEGEKYYLSFKYNSKAVSAFTEIPARPVKFKESDVSISVTRMDSTSVPVAGGMGSMPDPVSLTWDNSDASYYIVVIENMETVLDPIRDFGSETPPGNIFRKAPTSASGLQLRPQEFQYFGKHRIILYHVLPDYASLYSENSTSSQNLTNPSTSIVNGYGIFTGLNADTLYLNVLEN
jgi:hypothetical protein